MPFDRRVPVVARIVVTVALTLGVGCAGAGDSDPGDLDASMPSCGLSTETYANFGAAFLAKYCNSCHGFKQADAQQGSATLIDVAVTSTYMPPGSPTPTAAERMELGTWLACGAP
jgi:hypothetical protein